MEQPALLQDIMIFGPGDRMMSLRSLTKHLFLVCFFTLCLRTVYSQSITNSAYNVFGIGTLEQSGLVPFEAMGYAALGARPIDIVNIKNPAALNSIRGYNQIFDAGVSFSSLTQSSRNNTFKGSFGGLHDLNYWFRVSPKTALSFGVAKFSEASYDILDTRSDNNDPSRSASRHIGSGGSSEVYLAGSYRIFDNLNLGLKSRFLFSGQRKEELVSIARPSTDLVIESEQNFVKTILELGMQYEHKLSDSRSLTFGSTFRTGANSSSEYEELIISDSRGNIDTLSSLNQTEIFVPQKIGAGLSLRLPQWNFNLDYEFENWGSNEPQDDFDYRDRFITSFGGQFIKDRFSEKFLERIAFRFGAGIHSNYVSVRNEDYLSQYYSAGVGVPINRGAVALNMTYQYYSTGTTESNLIRESASSFSFSITIKDIWFIKRVYN